MKKEHSRNFGLSQMEFEALAAALRQGNESLFESIFLTRFNSCIQLLKRKYNASHESAYDASMWAMLKMRDLLLGDKVSYGNLEAYLSQIVSTYYLKQQMRNRETPTDMFLDQPEAEDSNWDEAIPVLEKAWNSMGDKCRMLLQAFYYDKIELKQLTAQFNDTSEANTRKKKERCLKELRRLFFEQL